MTVDKKELQRRTRDGYLRRTYGISLAEYEEMLERQEYRCAICGSKPRTKLLAVDHDRLTNRVRGLLCYRCNHLLLAGCHEEIRILRAAIEYLQRSLEA